VNRLRGASWGDDDWIVYAPDLEGGLFRVAARGGTPEQLTEPDKKSGESSHRFPHVLPGAGALVFMVSDGQRATVSAMDLRSRRRVDGLATGHGPHYLPSGHLAFVNRNGQLSLLPFDASNLATLGPATTLQETADIGQTGEFQGAAAASGALAFVPMAPPTVRTFAAIDRDGKERRLAIEPKPSGDFRVSPDGRSMVAQLRGPRFNEHDLWLLNFSTNVWTRLTTDRQSGPALWTPDGRDIVYQSTREGTPRVYRQAASPGSAASLILSVPGLGSVWPRSWLADGGLALTVSRGSFDVVLHESAGQPLRALVESNANEAGSAVSADGRWAAYASDASGQFEIYLTTIQEPRSAVKVSRSGGVAPIWAKSGNTLYFRRANQILATTVSMEQGILRTSPEKIAASGEFSPGVADVGLFDVMPDGTLIVMKDEPRPTPELRVIVNWAANALRNSQ
jgi:hypothetical protein